MSAKGCAGIGCEQGRWSQRCDCRKKPRDTVLDSLIPVFPPADVPQSERTAPHLGIRAILLSGVIVALCIAVAFWLAGGR